MPDERLPTVARLVVWLAATCLLLGVAAVLIAWSGLYNVAASKGHLPPTRWLLEFGMRQSVKTQSLGISVPPLDDSALVALGASHYAVACATCHGSPDARSSLIAGGMLPAPPSLMTSAPAWQDRQLFWIVKHGIKYTGMPAWPAQRRDDEVWAVVAFLRRMPGMTSQRYKELSLGNAQQKDVAFTRVVNVAPFSLARAVCMRCHDSSTSGPVSTLVPRLAGQRKGYLVSALHAYRSGERESGFMQPIASELDDEQIDIIATYYSELQRANDLRTSTSIDVESIGRGRTIAEAGVAKQAIPPCESCHGNAGRKDFPRLAGQSSAFMIKQLTLWRLGLRTGTDQSALMAPIAKRLTESQIRDVATYYASRTPAASSGSDQPFASGGPQR